MTLVIEYNASDQAGAIELEGIQSLTSAADGDKATSGLAIDDPDGSRNYIGLQLVTVDETACTPSRCFTGRIGSIGVSRGRYKDGPGRVWTMEVEDLNVLLHTRVLKGADAHRKAESFATRMAWFLSTIGIDGVIFDNGLIASRPGFMYDETDYRHWYHDAVLGDMARGWIFFVYWDSSATPGEEISLFFDLATSPVHDSTLRISDVLSDVDDIDDPSAITFAPYIDSNLEGTAQDIEDGVDYTYIGDANIYRTRAATFTTYGFHRDGQVSTDKVGRLATAEAQAQIYLDLHSGQIDTITCTVQLPRSKVNLIDAGMRLQVRFSFIPGYDDPGFTWTRVARRTLILTPGTNLYYDAQLTLSTKGVNTAGGGSPGDYPKAPCSDADLHYYAGSLSCSVPQFSTDCSDYDSPGVATGTTPTSFNYSVTITGGTADPNKVSFYVVDAGDHSAAYLSLLPLGGAGPFTGSFSVGAGHGANLAAAMGLLHNDIAPQDATIEFWIDPVGWVVPDCPPPSPGQWVGISTPEYVTMSGTGGTTAFPFADGSLRVFYDNIDQTAAIVSYDGAAGTFVMAGAPLPGWQVRVEYQGR